MDAHSALLALAVLAFQWGFQPAGDGTTEYIVQLRPQEAEYLLSSPGAPIWSYIPAEAQPVGRIRITVGEGTLPREPLATADNRRTIHDSEVQPASGGREVRVAETHARVPAGGESEDGRSPMPRDRYRVAVQQEAASDDPLHEYGPAASRDKDTAGELVVVPSEPGRWNGDGADGALPLTPIGDGFASDESTPPSQEDDAGDEPATGLGDGGSEATQRRDRSGLTQPTFSPEEPADGQQNLSLPPFGIDDHEAEQADRDVASPSDPIAKSPGDGEMGDGSERMEAAELDSGRPWLPLMGAVAVAFGFLAGNVFQWRSYMSLRKRYLQLLRKTGG